MDVDEEIVIGRVDTDLAIDDDEMSSRHAVVRRHANRLQVEAFGSTNGTFVDGARIADQTLLGGGAEIKVGTTVLIVEGVLPVPDSADITVPRNATRGERRDPRGRFAAAGRSGCPWGGADGRRPLLRPLGRWWASSNRPSADREQPGLALRSSGPGRAVVRHRDRGGDRAGYLLLPAHVKLRGLARASALSVT